MLTSVCLTTDCTRTLCMTQTDTLRSARLSIVSHPHERQCTLRPSLHLPLQYITRQSLFTTVRSQNGHVTSSGKNCTWKFVEDPVVFPAFGKSLCTSAAVRTFGAGLYQHTRNITSNTFYKSTSNFRTQICRKCLRIKLNGFRPVSTQMDITFNTFYKCTATFRTHCIIYPLCSQPSDS
jgi:hypothetical protein